jgi:hypothetical protein
MHLIRLFISTVFSSIAKLPPTPLCGHPGGIRTRAGAPVAGEDDDPGVEIICLFRHIRHFFKVCSRQNYQTSSIYAVMTQNFIEPLHTPQMT